jgi:hypothetical protein
MFRKLKRGKFFKIGSILIVFVFSAVGTASAIDQARIIPTKKVSIYRADKLIDELRAEAPLPYNDLLVCEGKCTVKMDNLLMATPGGASFSITAPPLNNTMEFVKGDIYFSISELKKPLVIKTPTEDITIQQLMLKTAAGDQMLMGYFSVTPTATEIAVIEGGSMIVSTSHGEQHIDSGKKLILAAKTAPASAGAPVADKSTGAWTSGQIWGAVLASAGVIGAALLWGGSSSSSDSPTTPPSGSPSTP